MQIFGKTKINTKLKEVTGTLTLLDNGGAALAVLLKVMLRQAVATRLLACSTQNGYPRHPEKLNDHSNSDALWSHLLWHSNGTEDEPHTSKGKKRCNWEAQGQEAQCGAAVSLRQQLLRAAGEGGVGENNVSLCSYICCCFFHLIHDYSDMNDSILNLRGTTHQHAS